MSWENGELVKDSTPGQNGNSNGSSGSYVQVPSSSPIKVNSSPLKDGVNVAPSHRQLHQVDHNQNGDSKNLDAEKERKLEAKRQAIRNHKDFPVIRRLFYYLDESAIFKGFVKGRGNLRDITKWLTENYRKADIIAAKEAESRERKELEKLKEREQRQLELLNEFQARLIQEEALRKQGVSAEDIRNSRTQHMPVTSNNVESKIERPANSIGLGSTNVSHKKPTVSILDKYKFKPSQSMEQMKQLRLDSLFGTRGGIATKKRKLVRGTPTSFDSSNSDTSGTSTPTAFPPSLLKTQPLKKESLDIDDLDILEQKIKENRKRRLNKINLDERDSDDEGEEDEEEDEEDDGLEDDDDGSDVQEMEEDIHEGLTGIDKEILDFLNTASNDDLMGICNVDPKVSGWIIQKRPYDDIYSFSEDNFEDMEQEESSSAKSLKGRKGVRKSLGQKIIDATESSLKGYTAINSLIKKCSEYGNLIKRDMEGWGVNVKGTQGEIEVVEIDEEDEVDVDAKNEEDDDIVVVKSRKGYIKSQPKSLAPGVELKNYQQVGINWLYLLFKRKLSCILADEMGLGKTCQVISFMALLQEKQVEGPHLVIVPSSTLENWLREFQKFCPEIRVQAYYGSQREREDLRYELQDSEFDVLVTTYNLATGASADFKFLKHQNFNVIVYDEGHMLKNSSSERYSKLMRLKAKFRLLLTGTPLQNNLKELVSILSFMLPQLFIDKKEDLDGLFNKKASTKSDYNPLLSQQAIGNARIMMAPFVLRRKKDQVMKHLPRKIHKIEYIEGTANQMAIYDEHLRLGKEAQLEKERRAKLPTKELVKINKENPMNSLSNTMMTLRKAALHPLLFRKNYPTDKLKEMAKLIKKEPEYHTANEQYIFEDMEVMTDFELDRLCRSFPRTMSKFLLGKEAWYDSGKVKKLLELVNEIIESKGKVLVFSLFTQMLDILEVVLSLENIKFLRLDGQTSVETRQDIIDQFYEDNSIPVFLLSTKAGGFGINLVVANNVIIYDQSYNPHDDRQAEDRAHRVGQEKEVVVTRLIVKDTVDENIMQLAQNKLELDETISSGDLNEKQIEEKADKMLEKSIYGK